MSSNLPSETDSRIYPYRVFISYPHEPGVEAMMLRLREHLEVNLKVRPICDVNIALGSRFSDEIKQMIATAHLFMPIVTTESASRPWVNQEIGYAVGLGVPVLPVAVGQLPEGLAESVQALKLPRFPEGLGEKLTIRELEVLVMASRHSMRASYVCTEGLYRRTDLIVEKSESLLVRGEYGRIRQRSAFSSFSIPNRGARHADWNVRDGRDKRDTDTRERLRAERQVMEAHARQAGCDLILDPYVTVGALGAAVAIGAGEPQTVLKHDVAGTRYRLQSLRDFLASMPANKIRVTLQKGKIEHNLVLVGDWFAVEAVVPHYGGGYRHSTFTEHGPTILRKIEEFDDELTQALRDQHIAPADSRDAALAEIDAALNKLET